jgi:hypothetical protein
VYDGYNDEQEKEIMTNITGSNNIAGLLGGLIETVETVIDIAGKKLSDFAEDTVGGTDEESDEPRVHYKAVAELGLADALVLEDGSWQVVAVQGDGFDPDIVSVSLDNGESYDLLRTSLVRVV